VRAAEVDGGAVAVLAVGRVVVGQPAHVLVVGLDSQSQPLAGFEGDGRRPDLDLDEGRHTGFEWLEFVVGVPGAMREGAAGVEFAVCRA
jgi:hypothetical protein